MGKIRELLHNKWVGFTLAALLYTLWFVVWTGNLWLLLGLPIIFDLYITKFFYRYVWSHNVKMCRQSKVYKTVYEWVNAIIFATVVATLVHIFIFQMYVIPTSSMERSLLVGDYLYVSKVAYGPQMPNTPLSFPFVHHTMPFSQTKKSFSEAIKWPYHRLKGLKPIRRNDVVVFNFPAGDTVLLEDPAVTYYDVVRDFERSFGKEEGRKRLNEEYTVISRPVDKRENYIKRCIAIPGDSLEIRDGRAFINGKPQEPVPGLQYNYVVQTSSPFTQYAIDNLGIREYTGNGSGYYMTLTDETAEKVKALSNVISVRRRYLGIQDQIAENEMAGRGYIWGKTFDMLSQPGFPIIQGTGWGTFITVFSQYSGQQIGAHNFYLNLLTTTGLIGLSLVVYYLYRLFLYLKLIKIKNKSVYYLLLVIPLISMLTTNWESRKWWFIISIFIYTLYRLNKNNLLPHNEA